MPALDPGARAVPERRHKILIVGVGGQGVLTAAKLLGEAAHDAGAPVVVGQLHGMSQRGGSVDCTVLLGPGASSYLVGDADVVVAFEPLEALRATDRIGPATRVLVSTTSVTPNALAKSGDGYPSLDGILARIREATPHVFSIDGPEIVRKVGLGRALNMAMLGALAGLGVLPFDGEKLWEALAQRCPARYLEANRRAFELGRDAVTREGIRNG